MRMSRIARLEPVFDTDFNPWRSAPFGSYNSYVKLDKIVAYKPELVSFVEALGDRKLRNIRELRPNRASGF